MLDLNKMENNTLLLVNGNLKKDILLQMSNEKVLKNIKVMSFNEFLKEYLFDYNTETIYYIMRKYNIKVDIANVYIKNLYYIDNVDYKDDKLIFLKELKQELFENKLLIENQLFREKIKSKNIVFYGYYNKYQRKILNNLNVTYIEDQNIQTYQHDIYEVKGIDEEVSLVARLIADLVHNGASLSNIKLANVGLEYRTVIRRIFSIFNIPINLNDNNSLYSTVIGNFFINNIKSNINETLEIIRENYNLNDELLNEQYNQILTVCNKYNWCDDYISIKDLLIYELKKASINNENNLANINIIDLEEYKSNSEDYIFLLGFNQGLFPNTEKNEDFLNDKLKEILGLENTVEKNIIHKERTLNFIKYTKNLVITYATYVGSELEISNLNEILQYPVIKDIQEDYAYSNLNNKLILGKMLDTYMKYGVKDKDLDLLLGTYREGQYRVYDNKFTGIDVDTLKEYKKGNLTLSYSSVDSYFHCAFRFYVSNILKLNIYEENFMNYIGSLFHYVLSLYYKDNFNFEDSWNKFLLENSKDLSKKEEFFLNKLKEELKFIIDSLDEQKKYTNFKDVLLEERINIDKSIDNFKINFVGIVDKILSLDKNNQKLVSVVDYKTGNPSLDLTMIPHGMGMQLPIYLYLIKNKWQDAKIVGFYLQKILPAVINRDSKKSYLEQKKDYLKLQGYSIKNESLLNEFDNTYENSDLIKSMKITSKGFSSYSKVLTYEEVENLNKLVDSNIDTAIKKIINGDFSINPKQVGQELVGCEFCKYKDICFKTNKDIKNLEEYKDISYLGGEKNA